MPPQRRAFKRTALARSQFLLNKETASSASATSFGPEDEGKMAASSATSFDPEDQGWQGPEEGLRVIGVLLLSMLLLVSPPRLTLACSVIFAS